MPVQLCSHLARSANDCTTYQCAPLRESLTITILTSYAQQMSKHHYHHFVLFLSCISLGHQMKVANIECSIKLAI